MHYKNGRLARNGDTVIGKPQFVPAPIVGIIQDINPGSTSCNCTVLRPGGMVQLCVTVGDLYHVEDAMAVLEPAPAQIKEFNLPPNGDPKPDAVEPDPA